METFATAGAMPAGPVPSLEPWQLTLHAGSDALLFASYFVIAVAILQFLRARPDVRIRTTQYGFAGFVLLGGLTHLLDLFALWSPIHGLRGYTSLLTALVTAATALIALRIITKLAGLPSPAQVRAANTELEAEVASHRDTLAELSLTRTRLEAEVEKRTRELSAANERLTVTLHETAHRTKNLITVVQSLLRQTAAHAETKEQVVEALQGRLASLAKALSSVIEGGPGGADLRAMIETQLEHVRDSYPDRISVDGPALPVRLEAVQQIGLAIHELATNAVKYGALSRPDGRVEIVWRVRGADCEAVVELEWREQGVPPRGPDRKIGKGLGSALLTRAVPNQLRGEVSSELSNDGYRYALSIPTASLEPDRPREEALIVQHAFPFRDVASERQRA